MREFSLDAAELLSRVVPFDGVRMLTLDPATLLPTAEVVENAVPSEARAKRFGDELRAVLADDDGNVWGALTLLRVRPFAAEERAVVASLTRYLAEGLRRAVLVDAPPDGQPDHVGLLVLGDDDAIVTIDAGGEWWLDELGWSGGASLPRVVTAAAARARNGGTDLAARARARTVSGHWLLVRGSSLGENGDAAVILERARPHELAPLIADAYGLTERERAVTELVAQGLPTSAIAERLHLSAWTVQDHLKSIFEKTGVGSRGELVARLFFEHYAPRL